MKRVLGIIIPILFADQILKIWVKLNLRLEEAIPTHGADFFELRFVENPGMAFGMEFPGVWGKLALTLFRIAAVVVISYMIYRLQKQNARKGLIFFSSMILAGAIGNIIDSVFYGVLFSESTPILAAQFMPPEGGYAPLFMGKVVDMFHFTARWPDWVPFIEGRPQIFQPVFNIADSAITVGVIAIIIRQKAFFAKTSETAPAEPAETGESES